MGALTVIKLGGSHAFATHLRSWLGAIQWRQASVAESQSAKPHSNLLGTGSQALGTAFRSWPTAAAWQSLS